MLVRSLSLPARGAPVLSRRSFLRSRAPAYARGARRLASSRSVVVWGKSGEANDAAESSAVVVERSPGGGGGGGNDAGDGEEAGTNPAWSLVPAPDELLLLPLSFAIGTLVAGGVFAFKESLVIFREVEWGAIAGAQSVVPPSLLGPILAGFVVSFIKTGGMSTTKRRSLSPSLKLMSKAASVEKDKGESWLPTTVRPAARKTLASIVTLGGGASLGTEAPSAELGANVALEAGRRAGLTRSSASGLLAIGAAAGIAASFETPIGGAIYSMEYLLVPASKLSPTVALSLALSSFTADWVVQAIQVTTGRGREFVFPEELGDIVSFPELMLFGAEGVICAGAALAVYEGVQLARWALRRFGSKLKGPLAGLGTGLVAVAFPAVGFGVEPIDVIVRNSNNAGVGELLSVAAAKLLATSVSLGGGLVGGLFLPSLAVGGFLGTAMGDLALQSDTLREGVMGVSAYIDNVATRLPLDLQSILAEAALRDLVAERFAMVGAAAVMGATCKCPLTATIMIFELTGEPGLLPALVLATAISSSITSRLEGKLGEVVKDLRVGVQEEKDAQSDYLMSFDELDLEALESVDLAPPPDVGQRME